MAKKKRKIESHAPGTHNKDYMSVGHTGGDVIVWAYVDGQVVGWHPDEGTHEELMGATKHDYWRGRYERHTNHLTVIIPDGARHKRTPQWLIDKLEEVFGSDFGLLQFNPEPKEKR